MGPGGFLGRSRTSRALLLGAAALLAAIAVLVATRSYRAALWPVVRACVAAERLAGRPFPCLEVDLAGGEARGHVVLRAPWSSDLILSPTRRSVGVEDPLLQSAEVPDDFADAWRARRWIATPDGRQPLRDAIALIVNPGSVRSQDQLHIHIACLLPGPRRALAEAAETLPWDRWRLVGPVAENRSFWALRIRSADLAGVRPIRLVRERFGKAVRDPAELMVAAVGAQVAGQDAFLILTSDLRPIGAEALTDLRCRSGSEPGPWDAVSGADGVPADGAPFR